MVESTGLENRQRGNPFVGSNPTSSAIKTVTGPLGPLLFSGLGMLRRGPHRLRPEGARTRLSAAESIPAPLFTRLLTTHISAIGRVRLA